MPQYLVANYLPDNFDPSTVTEKMMEEIHALNRELIASGARKFACGISPVANAKTLRRQPNGKVLVTDGPYTETKEHMGGFWIRSAPISTRRWRGLRSCHRLRCGWRSARASFLPGSRIRTRCKQVVAGCRQNSKDNQMRNVVYAINLTLDGCCDHTKLNPDEETHGYFTNLLPKIDLLVFGRKTYQLMVPFWPDAANDPSSTKSDIEFAQTFVSKKKIVFSRSLGSAEDENTRIVRTNLHDEILKLSKNQAKIFWLVV